ncbi:MAG: RNA polymerase sigma factor [Planctomycetota bacterium]
MIRRIADSGDHEGWDLFVERYGDVLRNWASRWGLHQADQEDLVQNILLELMRNIQRYAPTGRFRGWLRTVARRSWYDYTQRRKSQVRTTGTPELERLLASNQAVNQFVNELDAEANAELVELATKSVRRQVSESVWRAFEMMHIEGLSGEQAAKELGLRTGSVYVAASRVKKRLHDAVAMLDTE